MMRAESIDSNSNSRDSDFASNNGDEVDVHLNHYRVPKLIYLGQNGVHTQPISRSNCKQIKTTNDGSIMSLTELAAQKVACSLPFGLVECFPKPVPESVQCRIAFWSFPLDEEDIRLYTCLANGNADVFFRGEELISLKCVCDLLQVGFHLSANVKFPQDPASDEQQFSVAISFDRRRITSCSCSCSASTFWCQHAVAVCLNRIRNPNDIKLRAPVSESLERLKANQLLKFAQYLINELPQQILPAAQRLLDELLSGDKAPINQIPAAPDPTAGATIDEQTRWCLDDTHLSLDIQKILLKQCTAQPTVCSDVQSLHASAPPSVAEYAAILRAIRGREPEGLWNLITIVGEMMKRQDSNYLVLLDIMTEEVLKCEKIVNWWFETKVSMHSGSAVYFNPKSSSQSTSQYICSNFCDEIVRLWRLATMNPNGTDEERTKLNKKLCAWHLCILARHDRLTNNDRTVPNNITKQSKRHLLEIFPGFKTAMEGCLLDWSGWNRKHDRFEDQLDISEKSPAPVRSKSWKKKQNRKNKRQRNRIQQAKNKLAAADQSDKPSEPQLNPSEDQPDVPQCDPSSSSNNDSSDKNNNSEEPRNHGQSSPSPGPSGPSPPSTSHANDNSKHSNEPQVHDDGPLAYVEDNRDGHDDLNPDDDNNHNEPNDNQIVNHNNNNDLGDGDDNDDIVVDEENVLLQQLELDNPDPLPINLGRRVAEVNDERGPNIDVNNNNNNNRLDRDLQVYYMERGNVNDELDNPDGIAKDSLEDLIRINMKRLKDPLEKLFAQTESLYAHGHQQEAQVLALKFANEILSLARYPIVKKVHTLPRRRKGKGALDNRMGLITTEALAKIHFLANLFLDCPEYHGLVFKLALYGIEMKRSPASTKQLEVKIINQKQDLVMLIKSIAFGDEEMGVLRSRAQSITESVYGAPDTDALTVLVLSKFIFEAFVLSNTSSANHAQGQNSVNNPSDANNNNNNNPADVNRQPDAIPMEQANQNLLNIAPIGVQQRHGHEIPAVAAAGPPAAAGAAQVAQPINNEQPAMPIVNVVKSVPEDMALGFQTALTAISTRINFVEADHPLLGEGIRRLRGELALMMLCHYKEEQDKLDLILERLLDHDTILSSCLPTESVPATTAAATPTATTSSNANTTTSVAPSVATAATAANNGTSSACNGANPPSIVSTPDLSKPIKKPNTSTQPVSAAAYFMFELAKTVYDKAGGNSSTTHLFRPQLIAPNGMRPIHRRLHICCLRIALFSMSLSNRVSNNWIQRTYNGTASFIHEQALDIGLPAIKYLCKHWEGHLTPVETASIADKAGACSNDPEMRIVAAELARSCLKYAHMLGYNAVDRILAQCREHSPAMLEAACAEVEKVAESGNVCASVMFATARAWWDLYQLQFSAQQQQEGSQQHQRDGDDATSAVTMGMSHCSLDYQNASADSASWLGSTYTSSNGLHSYHHGHQYSDHHGHHQHPYNYEPVHWDSPEAMVVQSAYGKPTQRQLEFLKSAHRVGMSAMQTMKPIVAFQTKHSPLKDDDLLWLLRLSMELGRDYLLEFCQIVLQNIHNPMTLQNFVIKLMKFFEKLPYYHSDRTTMLVPVADKCIERLNKRAEDLLKRDFSDRNGTSSLEHIMSSAQDIVSNVQCISTFELFMDMLKNVDNRLQQQKHNSRSRTVDIKQYYKLAYQFKDAFEKCTCERCIQGDSDFHHHQPPMQHDFQRSGMASGSGSAGHPALNTTPQSHSPSSVQSNSYQVNNNTGNNNNSTSTTNGHPMDGAHNHLDMTQANNGSLQTSYGRRPCGAGYPLNPLTHQHALNYPRALPAQMNTHMRIRGFGQRTTMRRNLHRP